MSAVVLAAASQAEGNFLLPNGTFFVVLIIFLIVLGVIGTFVVPPISKVLKERENMVTKTRRRQQEIGRAVRRRPGRLREGDVRSSGEGVGGPRRCSGRGP